VSGQPCYQGHQRQTQLQQCGLTRLLADDICWQEVWDRVTFKQAVMVPRCLNRRAPDYLADYRVPLSTQRHLGSADRNLLYGKVTMTTEKMYKYVH